MHICYGIVHHEYRQVFTLVWVLTEYFSLFLLNWKIKILEIKKLELKFYAVSQQNWAIQFNIDWHENDTKQLRIYLKRYYTN